MGYWLFYSGVELVRSATLLRHLFALLMVLAASPLRAEVAAVIDDTTERFVLRHVHNEVFRAPEFVRIRPR